MEQHQRPASRSCGCTGLHRSGYYRIPEHWTVRGAEVVAALISLVERRPSRGFWKCRKLLRREGQRWNHKQFTACTNK